MITDKEEILKIKNFNVNNNSIINSFTRDYNFCRISAITDLI